MQFSPMPLGAVHPHEHPGQETVPGPAAAGLVGTQPDGGEGGFAPLVGIDDLEDHSRIRRLAQPPTSTTFEHISVEAAQKSADGS